MKQLLLKFLGRIINRLQSAKEFLERDISTRITSLRKDKNMTQRELAKALGLSGGGSVGEWEVGKVRPDIKNLRKLSEFFGVSISFLLTGREAKNNPKNKTSFNQLTDNEKEIIKLILSGKECSEICSVLDIHPNTYRRSLHIAKSKLHYNGNMLTNHFVEFLIINGYTI